MFPGSTLLISLAVAATVPAARDGAPSFPAADTALGMVVRGAAAPRTAPPGIAASDTAGPQEAARSAAGSGAASNWQIMVWTDPLTVSLDTSSITTHAARTTARVMWDYAQQRRTTGAAGAVYKSMIGVLVFDCATMRFGGAGSVSYSGDGGAGEPVARFSINPDEAKLSSPEPGTIAHELLDTVCSYSKKAALHEQQDSGNRGQRQDEFLEKPLIDARQ